jgi:hypothetical protein
MDSAALTWATTTNQPPSPHQKTIVYPGSIQKTWVNPKDEVIKTSNNTDSTATRELAKEKKEPISSAGVSQLKLGQDGTVKDGRTRRPTRPDRFVSDADSDSQFGTRFEGSDTDTFEGLAQRKLVEELEKKRVESASKQLESIMFPDKRPPAVVGNCNWTSEGKDTGGGVKKEEKPAGAVTTNDGGGRFPVKPVVGGNKGMIFSQNFVA